MFSVGNRNKSNKEVLAKLMAKENVIVTYDSKAKIACFNTVSRVLTLPVMENKEEYVYDWFIAHEVSHALYTPVNDKFYADIKDNKGLMGYFNVTEDARIEKLIKLKYPGTKKDSRKFYEHFADPDVDFFKIKDKDIQTLPLIDRINLHFKIGHIIPISFDIEEQPYVDMVDYAMTAEAALEAAKKIYEREKKKQQESSGDGSSQSKNNSKEKSKLKIKITDKSKEDQDQQESSGGDSQDQQESSGGDMEIEMSPEEFADSIKQSIENGDQQESSNGDTEIEIEIDSPSTQTAFDKALEDIMGSSASTQYISIDNNTKSIRNIINNSEAITKQFEAKYQNFSRYVKYQEFMASAKPLVNMMGSYFNMKKKASEYQKVKQSKTGDLNLDALSEYLYNDDIFLRNDVIKEAKNHGLFFLLDWSGSMENNIKTTFKQVLVLIEFCRIVGIPYELYGFSSSGGGRDNKGVVPDRILAPGLMGTNRAMNIIKLMDSSMSKKQHTQAAECVFTNNPNTIMPMSGTPLSGSIFVCDELIKRFQQRTKCEKTVFCILTDGGSDDCITSTNQSKSSTGVLVDKMFNKYKTNNQQDDWKVLTQYIKNTNNLHSTVGFYLTPSANIDAVTKNNFFQGVKGYDQYQKTMSQKGIVEVQGVLGYDRYFFVSIGLIQSYLKDLTRDSFEKLSTESDEYDAKKAFIDNIQNRSLKSMAFLKVFIEQIS